MAEGEISELHIGLKGTMSALYLKDLAQKTHRGFEGRLRDGKSAGGISYGYRARRELRPDGTLTTGERVIDLIRLRSSSASSPNMPRDVPPASSRRR